MAVREELTSREAIAEGLATTNAWATAVIEGRGESTLAGAVEEGTVARKADVCLTI